MGAIGPTADTSGTPASEQRQESVGPSLLTACPREPIAKRRVDTINIQRHLISSPALRRFRADAGANRAAVVAWLAEPARALCELDLTGR